MATSRSGEPRQSTGTATSAGFPPLFTGSVYVSHGTFDVELMPQGAGACPELLLAIRDQVVDVAARSREWNEPEHLEHFDRVFKLESLYAADGLALVWQAGRLVGLAGYSHDAESPHYSVLHLGSLGLLPRAQRRGILPVLFSLLWEVVQESPRLREDYRRERLYLTAITQSPFIVSFFDAVTDLYPAPGREAPDARAVAIATMITERYDPHIAFDPRTFVLREECEFFYRRIPYSTNREINAYCDSRLRYAAGDTFVLVGQVRTEAISRFVTGCRRAYPDLYLALQAKLRGRPGVPGRLPRTRAAGRGAPVAGDGATR
jgi:hypothetical protein